VALDSFRGVTKTERHEFVSTLPHHWFDSFTQFGTASASLSESFELIRAYAWTFKGEVPAMRFWSVTLLIATLLVLLYAATYFSLSPTSEPTSRTSTRPSAGQGASASGE